MGPAADDGQRRVDPQALQRAVAALLRGGLVGLPTETVYGLAADADQPAAVAAIFDAKGRPRGHPLILHVADAAAAAAWARECTPAAQTLIARFWPGPLTLVLPRAPRAADIVTGGQDSVGLRCPAHPWAQALLRAYAAARGDAAVALAAPSANRYGRISPTRAEHVRSDLGEKPAGRVDVILDAGPCPLGIESTIVDCTGPAPRILRPGSISRVALAAALGAPVAVAGEGETAPRVSGRVAGHYAPRTPLELIAPAQLIERCAELAPRRLGVLAPAVLLARLHDAPAGQRVVALDASGDPQHYAQALYTQLRRLDDSGVERLLIALPPSGSDWDGINDRLRRAAVGSQGGGAAVP